MMKEIKYEEDRTGETKEENRSRAEGVVMRGPACSSTVSQCVCILYMYRVAKWEHLFWASSINFFGHIIHKI